ncbi:hypothetical protein ACHAPT_007286 [Fusarium lateritium]
MAAPQPDSAGLEVDPDARAPELVPQYDPYDQNNKYGAAAHDQPYPYPGQQPDQKPKGPFGTTFLTFGILIAAITALIVGGALGGGLGAALASCQNSECSVDAPAETSACPTPQASDAAETNNNATYLPKLYNDVANLTIDCDESGFKESFTVPGGVRFDWYCGVDARKTKENSIRDIGVVIAYTIQDCAAACSQMMNAPTGAGEDPVGYPCKAVVFDRGMAHAVNKYGGNCWLKSDKKASGDNIRWTYNAPHLSYAEMK